MRLFLILCLILFLTGCKSMSLASIDKHFLKIKYSDGINEKEAKLLAQKTLKDSHYTGYTVDVTSPLVVSGKDTGQYPSYWFISFPNFDTTSQMPEYLFVIDKRTAGIVRQGWWNPYKQPEVGWIFKEKVSF